MSRWVYVKHKDGTETQVIQMPGNSDQRAIREYKAKTGIKTEPGDIIFVGMESQEPLLKHGQVVKCKASYRRIQDALTFIHTGDVAVVADDQAEGSNEVYLQIGGRKEFVPVVFLEVVK